MGTFGSRIAAVAALAACLIAAALVLTGPAAARQQPLNLRVTVALVPSSGATLHYRGTFTGTPFGRGKAVVRTSLTGAGHARVSFELSTARGSVRGTADASAAYHGETVTLRGTAAITQGTGAYSRIRARGLRISGRSGISADRSTLNLSGKITS